MSAEELGFTLLRLQGPVIRRILVMAAPVRKRPVTHRLQTSIILQYRQVVTT